ncbi:MAG: 3'-5' exoribonuclease YhaM family protein [Candidatus Brocadiales bacterium]
MGRTFIKQLKAGGAVNEVFLLRSREVRSYGNGKLYIQAQLADKTGAIGAVMWDVDAAQIESFGKDGFLRVQGLVKEYKNKLQLEIKDFSRELIPPSLEELLPTAEKDIEELKKELEGIIDSVKDPHLSQLLKLFLADEDISCRLSSCPASVSYHHAYLGGLLDHIVSVTKLAMKVADHYHPILNRDLLVTGMILHDIGKLRELSYQGGFQYTDQGRLVGHIVTGVLMVEEKAAKIKGFPAELLDLVRHIILSHHGDADTNSPRTPMTAEALAVHYLDNLDAKLQGFSRIVSEDRDPDSRWTEFHKMFGTMLYKGTEGS